MDIIAELEILDRDLSELKKNFNNQMNAVEGDLKEFHKHLIALSAKYPDHKELLEFIVFINDRIETNQTNFKEVLLESINEIILIKRSLIKYQIKSVDCSNVDKPIQILEVDTYQPRPSSIMEKLTALKELKWVLSIIFILILFIGFLVAPEATKEAVSHTTKIIGK